MSLVDTGKYIYISNYRNIPLKINELFKLFKQAIQFHTLVDNMLNLIVYDHISNKKYIMKSMFRIIDAENNKEKINEYFDSLEFNDLFRDDIDLLLNDFESIGKLQDNIKEMVSKTNRNYIFHYGIRKEDYHKDESI